MHPQSRSGFLRPSASSEVGVCDGNTSIEPIWNRRFIGSIQITVSEYIDVEGRGGYYVQPASLREIILNYQLADSPGTPTLIKKDTS